MTNARSLVRVRIDLPSALPVLMNWVRVVSLFSRASSTRMRKVDWLTVVVIYTTLCLVSIITIRKLPNVANVATESRVTQGFDKRHKMWIMGRTTDERGKT